MTDKPGFQNENTWLRFQREGAEDKFHRLYEDAVADARKRLGREHGLRLGSETISSERTFTVRSPADSDIVIGTFASATKREVDRAVRAAREAFESWARTSYGDRAAVFERAATLMVERKWALAATMAFENGKNRYEGMADVDEAIDFLRFYSAELRRHKGFVYDVGGPYPGEHCTSVLRPYGVFAVIAPFNFPLAILVGMTAGAVITGNTAVVKPASATPLVAHEWFDILTAAGAPPGVVNLITGGGREAGQPLLEHPDVQGVVFTGSRAVGDATRRLWLDSGKTGPVIAELGGKNAVIVSDKADLDKAVPGVWKAAFGFGGQKCSACSRVYVHDAVYDAFVQRLVSETERIVVGRPERKDTFLGPVIDETKVDEYLEAAERARKDGKLLTGGYRVTDGELARGTYVAPAIAAELGDDHPITKNELFLPFVSLYRATSLEDALARANDSDYALTSGFYSEDPAEVLAYLKGIEAGVVYVNRPRSACTGALVQGQAFGGWKHSGTTGKFAGGYWYLPQFMKEQTRTVVK